MMWLLRALLASVLGPESAYPPLAARAVRECVAEYAAVWG